VSDHRPDGLRHHRFVSLAPHATLTFDIELLAIKQATK